MRGEYGDPRNYAGARGSCAEEKPWLPGIDTKGSVAGDWVMPMPGADRIFRVAGFGALAPGAQQAIIFPWQYPGLVTALMCHDLNIGSDAGLASLAIQLNIGDNNEAVFSNGGAGDFVTFMCIHGRLQQPFPIMRYVHQNELWTVTVINRQPGGGTTFTPEVSFHYRRIDASAGRSNAAVIAGIHR